MSLPKLHDIKPLAVSKSGRIDLIKDFSTSRKIVSKIKSSKLIISENVDKSEDEFFKLTNVKAELFAPSVSSSYLEENNDRELE